MYSIILRGDIEDDDVQISDNNLEIFRQRIEQYLSHYKMIDTYLYERLSGCARYYICLELQECLLKFFRNVSRLTPGQCPRIFDSWSCFDSAPPDTGHPCKLLMIHKFIFTVQLSACPQFPALKFATQRFAFKVIK